jgi:hypothetical protein
VKTEIHISTGKYFPKPLVLLGYIGILFGLLGLRESILTGLTISTVSALISFNQGTLVIDVVNQRLKNYPFLFGLKLGSWISIKPYTEIAVLRMNVSERTFGGRTNKSVIDKKVFFDIYLLDSSHTKKLVINRYTDYESAIEVAESLAAQISKRFTKYNPVRTNSTKRRR